MSSYYKGYGGYNDIKPKFPKLDNSIKIDWELFYVLLYKQSPSKSPHQDRYVSWLVEHIRKNHDVKLERDSYGNIYVTKGEAELYPCVICHTDINQDYTNNLKVERNSQWIYGMDMDTGLQCGVGFDDKNGNLFALMMLDRIDTIKVAFFKDEEIGAVGSRQANAKFFHDCSMIFQMDRNSYKGLELITKTNGIQTCNAEFVDAAKPLMKKYQVIESTGSFTDVGEILKLKGVDCIGCNIGAGYFDEHTEQEITSIQALENSINFGYECLTQLGNVKWYHKATSLYENTNVKLSSSEKSYPSKSSKISWDRYDDWDDIIYSKSYEKPKTSEYRHILAHEFNDDFSNDEIENALTEGYCPCCLGEHTVNWDSSDDVGYCTDCGSYYYVPEDWFENSEKLNKFD